MKASLMHLVDAPPTEQACGDSGTEQLVFNRKKPEAVPVSGWRLFFCNQLGIKKTGRVYWKNKNTNALSQEYVLKKAIFY